MILAMASQDEGPTRSTGLEDAMEGGKKIAAFAIGWRQEKHSW